MKLITSTDLQEWGKTRESQEKIPLLIRRLIINNIGFDNIDFIDIPGGDSIWKPGLDGKIISRIKNILGDANKTFVIECGQTDDIEDKFKEDLKKRTFQLQNKTNSIFCFITTHKWRNKEETINKVKNSVQNSNLWAEIKTFDADDIESWLDHDHATMAWLADILGKPTNGIKSFDTYWNDWKKTTIVPIDEDIILARKNSYTKDINQWLLQQSGPLKIKADTRKEAVLFFLSSILKSNLNTNNIEAIKSQVAIVDNEYTWNKIVEYEESKKLILVSMFGIPENLGRLIDKKYKIVILYGDGDGKAKEDNIIYIDPINTHILFHILQEKIESIDKVNNLIQKLGENSTIIHLQRILERKDAPLPKPKWANKDNWQILLLAALIGSWDSTNEKDIEAVSSIFNMEYNDIVLKLSTYVKIEEAPIKKTGNIWIISNPDIIVDYFSSYLTEEIFSRYIKETFSILSLINPKYNIPKENRSISFFNFENKIEQYYSKELIIGISQGYSIISSFQNNFTSNLKVQNEIEKSINKILYEKDWKTWATLSKVLYLLAEAAPSSFLNSLKDIVEKRKRVIEDIYTQSISLDNNFYSGSEYLFIGILSALEILSWFDEYIFEATHLLIELESIQKTDTKLVNSPLNSLKEIYCPWYPNTAVSLDHRKLILDKLVKNNPNKHIIFNLLLELLYSQYQTTSHTSHPLYLNIPEYKICSEEELSDFYNFIFTKILTFLNDDIFYWSKIIDRINSLNEIDFDKFISKIDNMNLQDKKQDFRNSIFQYLNQYVKKTEYFIKIDEEKKEEYSYKINKIKNIIEKLGITDTIEQNIQLFSDGIVWDYLEGDREKELLVAIKNIIDEHGIKGIIEFAKKIDNSQILGTKLAQILELRDIKHILNTRDNKNDKIRNLVANLFVKTISIQGSYIIDQIFNKKWNSEYKKFLLTSIYNGKEYWDWIDKNNFSELYWKHVKNIFADTDEEYEFAINKLNNHKNFPTMLELLYFQIHKNKEHIIKTNDIVNLLEGLSSNDNLTSTLNIYDLVEIFKVLQKREDVNEQKVFQLEIKYFDLFNSNNTIKPITIYKQLKSNPKFFIEILSILFSSKILDSEQRDNQKLQDIAHKLYIKLRNSFPFDSEKEFIPWFSRLQEILNNLKDSDKDLYKISIRTLGQMIANSPNDPKDKIFPTIYVRNVIESFIDIDELKYGIYIGKINSIGVRHIDPVDPGKDYKKWAKEFKENADKLRFEYPKTAKILDFLANKYLEIGKMRDDDIL